MQQLYSSYLQRLEYPPRATKTGNVSFTDRLILPWRMISFNKSIKTIILLICNLSFRRHPHGTFYFADQRRLEKNGKTNIEMSRNNSHSYMHGHKAGGAAPGSTRIQKRGRQDLQNTESRRLILEIRQRIVKYFTNFGKYISFARQNSDTDDIFRRKHKGKILSSAAHTHENGVPSGYATVSQGNRCRDYI